MSSEIVVLRNTLKILQSTFMLPRNLAAKNFGARYYVNYILINLSTLGMLTGTVLHFWRNVRGWYIKILFNHFYVNKSCITLLQNQYNGGI